MKNQLLLKTLLSAFIISGTCVFSESKAQTVVVTKKHKTSDAHIFVPNPKKPHTVIVGEYKKLPPGQEKKIYGAKSAKPFAPGQRKKTHTTKKKYNYKK